MQLAQANKSVRAASVQGPHAARINLRRAMRAAPRVNAAAVETKVDWASVAKELDPKSPLEIMDHALKTFGTEIGIAFSGAEDVALIEYAHLTGRPYRVFRYGQHMIGQHGDAATLEQLSQLL
eukprot:GHUV01056526.1.p1 GENE.GHUV01056526.1~~GHUV01056526.1.p1  ORF type:complete len:123 (-),score=27.01 GHUV01056526.1:67-435(-)